MSVTPGGGGYEPARWPRSAPFTPGAWIRTSSSPSPATGSGRSSTTIRRRRWQPRAFRHATEDEARGDPPRHLHHRRRPGNVEFYAGVLGLRLVKKTVNQDDPTVYHLFYADELGSAGADITFFEYPGVGRGRAGDGMVHTICFRVALRRVARLVAGAGRRHDRGRDARARGSRRACGSSCSSTSRASRRSSADAPDIPAEHRAARVRRCARLRLAARAEHAGCSRRSASSKGWVVRGDTRSGFYVYDEPPAQGGLQSGGTVHHVAFASQPAEHEAWRQRVIEGGGHPTPVIDRFYFKSIYFREPSGVLFEIATIGPGLHLRRAARDARRVALAAAELRAVPLAGRADPDAASRSAARARRMIVRERPAAGASDTRARAASTDAAPTRTTSSPCSTCSTPSGGCDGFTPRGPLSLPPGGAHWYIVPRVGFPDRRRSGRRTHGLVEWLDALPHEKLVLGGFSQGCVMSLAIGLGSGAAAGRGLRLLGLHPHRRRLGDRHVAAAAAGRARARDVRSGDPGAVRPRRTGCAARGGRRGALRGVPTAAHARPGVPGGRARLADGTHLTVDDEPVERAEHAARLPRDVREPHEPVGQRLPGLAGGAAARR